MLRVPRRLEIRIRSDVRNAFAKFGFLLVIAWIPARLQCFAEIQRLLRARRQRHCIGKSDFFPSTWYGICTPSEQRRLNARDIARVAEGSTLIWHRFLRSNFGGYTRSRHVRQIKIYVSNAAYILPRMSVRLSGRLHALLPRPELGDHLVGIIQVERIAVRQRYIRKRRIVRPLLRERSVSELILFGARLEIQLAIVRRDALIIPTRFRFLLRSDFLITRAVHGLSLKRVRFTELTASNAAYPLRQLQLGGLHLLQQLVNLRQLHLLHYSGAGGLLIRRQSSRQIRRGKRWARKTTWPIIQVTCTRGAIVDAQKRPRRVLHGGHSGSMREPSTTGSGRCHEGVGVWR